MTEYLKNNPVALRHCLLYEILQRNTHVRAFTVFRDTIGSDVFTEEEVRTLFNQFRKRKMEGSSRPITDLRDVLRNDKYALRACVLYEFIKYKQAESDNSTSYPSPKDFWKLYEIRRNPSFALHSNFCKKLGENAMGYPEFDFWFRRFVNGEFDLNYERDTDMKLLTDMPLDIMRKVFEYSHNFDRLALAETSRSLKTFVEDHKQFYSTLEFQMDKSEAYISFGDHSIIYQKRVNDSCQRSRRGYFENEELLRGVRYWKRALVDLKNILNHPKLHLKKFRFTSYIPDDAIWSLEFPTQLLHVEDLYLYGQSMAPLLKILPALKPGYLTTMKLHSCKPDDDSMKKIVEMEQFKQAKYFYMSRDIHSDLLHHFYRFKKFEVRLRELSVEDIREMKERLFKSPDFEKCEVKVNNADSFDMDTIRQEFGGPIRRSHNTYHYPIINSTEYFEIKTYVSFYYWSIEITRKNN